MNKKEYKQWIMGLLADELGLDITNKETAQKIVGIAEKIVERDVFFQDTDTLDNLQMTWKLTVKP